MAVKVRCTGCDKVLTAPDAARGKSIKCPSCDTKVKVPVASSKPKKSAAKAVDSEDALASIDLRQAEDENVRICGKCGFDMTHQDEEETECPKCGYDSSVGGLGEKAQKKRLKGPDPDKFYEGLWKANWKFVFKNQGLAWRTMIYTIIASMLMFLCSFLYLYIPMWPPRMFFALCATVSGLMIPGWLWFMDQEVMVATLQRKDKLKRVNFDFFLCSALGIRFVAWHLVFALPVMLIPLLIGWILTYFGGMPSFVFWIVAGIGYLPVFAMLPISTGHFVMPVQGPGWMFWKVVPAWFRTLKPTLIWLSLTLLLHLPVLGCLGTIGAVYGPQINQVVAQMEENADTARFKNAKERAGKKDQAKFADDPRGNKEFHKPDYSIFIVPGILWGVSCLFLGFPAAYSCRVNGQFIYFFRDSLDLIALTKEYKYVAKVKPDEDEDAKPKTTAQVALESAVLNGICLLIGIVIGIVTAAFGTGQSSTLQNILICALYGTLFGSAIGRLQLISAGFQEGVGWGFLVWAVPFGDIIYVVMHWEDGAPGCLTQVIGFCMTCFILILGLVGLFAFSDITGGNPNRDNNIPVDAAPADPMPMPGGEAAPAAP